GSFTNHDNRAFAFAVSIRCDGAGHRAARTQPPDAVDFIKGLGKRDCDRSTFAGRALDLHASGENVDELLCNVQAEAGAFVRPTRGGVRPAELLEHETELVGGDADTGVLHIDGE